MSDTSIPASLFAGNPYRPREVLLNSRSSKTHAPSPAIVSKDNFAFKIADILDVAGTDRTTSISTRIDQDTLFIHDFNDASETKIRQELSRILQDTSIQKIRFGSYLSTTKKRMLANVLSRNHPLIEILRLVPGNDVVNISFSGIKKLNDAYGQAFTDKLLFLVKERIIAATDLHKDENGSVRLVRSDYKNITFSVPPGIDIRKLLFHDTTIKTVFLQDIVQAMDSDISILAIEKHLDPEDIKADIAQYWNFGVGKSHVHIKADNKAKLCVFAQAELVSRDGLLDDSIAVKSFEASRSFRFAEESVRLESAIVEKWEGLEFSFEGVVYPAIVHINGQKRIHMELLRQARKNLSTSPIIPDELYMEIRKYLAVINNGFDFIAPSHNLDEDLVAAQKISDDFREGIIQRDSFLNNYKGVMTKESFMQVVGKKNGIRVFIDIKDMGIQNIQSFQYLSRKIASGRMGPDDLLLGGKGVTDSFIMLIKKIQDIYPEGNIALGGDEIYLFLPEKRDSDSSNILGSIHDALESSRLEGRLSYSFENKEAQSVFKKLDESTVLHKLIESLLRGERAPHGSQNIQHETISFHIGEGISVRDVNTLLLNSLLQKEMTSILRLISLGKPIASEKIPIPIEGGQLVFRHDKGILHFIFTKPQ